jgi:hypothetical protein
MYQEYDIRGDGGSAAEGQSPSHMRWTEHVKMDQTDRLDMLCRVLAGGRIIVTFDDRDWRYICTLVDYWMSTKIEYV